MICKCCGQKISGTNYPVDNGKNVVCATCWNNPNLFFPEKMETDERLKLLSEMAKKRKEPSEKIHIQVIRFSQKGIEMYIGKLTASTLLKLCDVDNFEEKELTGYQRELFKERTAELVEYLDECPVAIMPGLFASFREGKFIPKTGDIGFLEIPQRKGSIWMIDGQHRIGGFDRISNKFIFDEHLDVSPELFSSLMDYELPIVFLNSTQIAKKLCSSDDRETSVNAEDLERAMFFVVNKTQKGINPSLRDALLYRMKMGGLKGIPALRKDKWRIQGAAIAISLNKDEKSPLNELINIGGKREQGKPIQLNSFVSSLEKILHNKDFLMLSDTEQLQFIRQFWKALGQIIPKSFDQKTTRQYMTLKSLGVHTLHLIALDIFKTLKQTEIDDCDEELLTILHPLAAFDWDVNSSPLSKLGGMKGVSEAHKIVKGAIEKEKSDLSNIKTSKEQRLD